MNPVLRTWLGWIGIWGIFTLSTSLLFIHAAPPAITETATTTFLSRGPRLSPIAETRFTAIVNGHAVECVRRVDRTQHTQSLAC